MNNLLSAIGAATGVSNYESNQKQQGVQQEMLYLLYAIFLKLENIEQSIEELKKEA